MKERMLSFVYLSIILACTITFLALHVIASSGQLETPISWLSFMEFLTPILILGWALTIHFVHKVRAALMGNKAQNLAGHRFIG